MKYFHCNFRLVHEYPILLLLLLFLFKKLSQFFIFYSVLVNIYIPDSNTRLKSLFSKNKIMRMGSGQNFLLGLFIKGKPFKRFTANDRFVSISSFLIRLNYLLIKMKIHFLKSLFIIFTYYWVHRF